MGAFQNHLHALYGLPGGLIQAQPSISEIDMHDYVPKKKRRKKKKEEEQLIKRGVAELRFHPKDYAKFDFKGTVKEALGYKHKVIEKLDTTSEEEEFLISLLLDDYDD